MKNVPGIESEKIDVEQLALAEQLVSSLAAPFSKVSFEDRYRDALMELVNDKIEGKEIVSIGTEEEPAPVVDIMSALKASIEASKKMKKGA